MRGNSKKIDGSESRVGYYPTQLTKKGKDTCILCKATTKNRAAMASPRIRTMRGLMSAFNAGGMDGERDGHLHNMQNNTKNLAALESRVGYYPT